MTDRTSQDAASQSRPEGSLQISDVRFQRLFETMPEGFVSVAMDGRIQDFNESYRRMVGYEADELPKLSYVDLTPEKWHAFEMEIVETQILARGYSDVYQKEYRRKDGTIFPIELRTILIRGADGNPAGMWAIIYDITERKKAEAELARHRDRLEELVEEKTREAIEKERRFRAVFDHARDAVFIVQPDGRFVDANQAACESLGYTREELLQRSVADIDPEYDAALGASVLKAVLESGFAVFERVLQRKDRTCFPIEIALSSYPSDRRDLLIAIIRDTTERKRAEQAIQESESNLREFFHSIVDMVFVVDRDGAILNVNESASERLGYAIEELIGRHVLCVHPADRREEAGRILADAWGQETTTCRVPLLTKDGHVFPAETRVVHGVWSGRDVLFGISKDISELQASEEKFVKAFESNPLPMAVTSLADRTFVDVNRAFCESLGHEKREVVGKTARELNLFLESDRQETQHEFVQEAGAFAGFEADIRMKDGRLRHGIFAGDIIHVQGKPFLLTVMNDITERTRAEAELRASKERFELVVRAADAGIWDWDITGGKIYYSPRWKAMFGYQEDEIGESLDDWARMIHPDERDWIVRLQEDFLASLLPTLSAEYRLRHKDGSYRWIFATGTVVRDANGKAVRFVGSHTDITARKTAEEELAKHREHLEELVEEKSRELAASERRLSRVLANLPGVAYRWLADGQWTLDYLSDGYEALFGYPKEGVLGRPVAVHFERVQSEERQAVFEEIARATAERRRYQFQYRIRTPSGETKWIWSRGVGVYSEKGELLGIEGFATDVTARKQAEEALSLAKEAAEAANQAKTQFLANISHELRTPMNAVLGMMELAMTEPISPVVRDYLATSRQSAETLLHLLNELLDYSRIEAEQLALAPSPFSLRQLLNETLKTIGIRGYEKGLELIEDVADGVPDMFLADALRLRQVLVNLVGNAVKFTHHGEVAVAVRVLSRSDRRVDLEFAVRDTGIGISAEDQQRIFSPFTQADASTTREYGGTGLGLTIAASLIRLMGGQIQVESQPGRGSSFSFSVPVQLAWEDLAAAERRREAIRPLQGLPALVIDDNLASCEAVQRHLNRWRMKAQFVQTVDAAKAKIRRAADAGQPFSLVVIDAIMPGADGFEMARWLRKNQDRFGAMVMLVSVADRQTQVARCHEVNAFWADKPISERNLFEAVLRATGRAGLVGEESPPAGFEAMEAPLRRLLRVLVVEDVEPSRELVAAFLAKRGHSTTLAGNGREAIELAGKSPFDVILMDIQMPIMDGYQAVAAIRAMQRPNEPHIPIVAMTAHAMKGDREKILAAGMDDYLAKPIRGEELIRCVERVAGVSVEKGLSPSNAVAEPAAPKCPFNIDAAMDRCCNREMFRKMVDFFFADADRLMQEARAAVHRQDAPTVGRSVHRLKGTVFYLGAQPTLEAANRVEAAASTGDLEATAETLGRLEGELDRLKEALAAHSRKE